LKLFIFDECVCVRRGGAVLSRWFRDSESDAVGVTISAVAEGGKCTYAVQNFEPACSSVALKLYGLQ